jgi:hypothetical protein
MPSFMAPTVQQYKQAVLSSLFSASNLKTIGLVFLAALIALYFLKFFKSLLIKILVALLITAIFILCLYFKTSASIRF